MVIYWKHQIHLPVSTQLLHRVPGVHRVPVRLAAPPPPHRSGGWWPPARAASSCPGVAAPPAGPPGGRDGDQGAPSYALVGLEWPNML